MSKKHNRFRADMTKEQIDQLQGTEIKAKRTRFGKVYALGGNRFQAITYTDPVHRYNAGTREWEEIDNRFSATPRMQTVRASWQRGIMPALSHSEPLLECKTGNMDIDCGMSGEEPFITLTDTEGHKLAWGIEGAMSILPEAEQPESAMENNVRHMREKVLEHLHGEVVYSGIFAGVDLRCKLDRGFKDELLFAEKESVRPITFLLESEGRQMEMNEQNMLIVKNEQGESIFHIQAPFMVDADDRRGDVAVQLEDRENGMYAMTYIPDAEFVEKASFPVVLDPAVESLRGEEAIEDTYVQEGSSVPHHTNEQVWVCNNSTYGKRYGYMRVLKLPEIDSNHFITGAYLSLKNFTPPSAVTALMCSEVLGDWAADELTFATQPEINPLYQDYCKFPANQYTRQQLDVTSLARKWYLGNNKGIILTPASTSPNTIRIQSSNCSAKPYFIVNYASLAGLESYLTYDSQSAGIAGSGSVSLVNGNLIFAHNDTAMNGNRMPVSITHYYNSCDSNVNEFGLGYGWRTSVHQTLHKEYINDEIMYVYTDGDGTEHWFELDEDADEVQYVDMSGLSLTLTVAEDGLITITSKSDSRMVFPLLSEVPTAEAPCTGKVLIQSIHDAVGNYVAITPVPGHPLYVQSVKDGAERVTVYEYSEQTDNSMMCTAIKTPWQDEASCTRFSYVDGCLTQIIHEDNRTSSYLYEERNGYQLLTHACGTDGFAVRYEYTNRDAVYGLPHCITYAETGEASIIDTDASEAASTQEETAEPALYSAKTSYNYGNHLTLVTDQISGKTLRYHFNDQGNQTSVDDGLGYAVYTEYDQNDDNANIPINHATTRSRMQRVVKNLLLDHSFEGTGSDWTKSGDATFLRNTSVYYQGMVSQKIILNSGEAVVQQTVTLKPGNSYTFSGYGKSAAPNAVLRVIYTVDGIAKVVESKPFPILENAADQEFVRQAFTFHLPQNASPEVVCAMAANGTPGACWFDCLQLEEGLTCNHYNMLQNGDFTRTNTAKTLPTIWKVGPDDSAYVSWRDLSVADENGVMAPDHLQSNGAVRLIGRYGYTITMYQVIRWPGNAGDRYTLGGWCKTYAKKTNIDDSTYCRIRAEFSYGDPSTSNVTPSLGGAVYFNPGEEGWQFSSGSIVAPCNYTYIRITMQMNRQMNYADFSNLYLYPEPFGTDYVYDERGNRTKAIQLYKGVKQAEYDDHDNMIKYTAPGHTKSSTFSYGESEAEQKKHLLLESHSPLGTDGNYSYDAFGNAICSDVSGSCGEQSMITRNTTAYQADGNYVYQQTDARGKTVTTVVDPMKGTTAQVTDPKGQAVEYTYDNLRRVTEVKTIVPGETAEDTLEYRNEYTYDPVRGLLTSVKHNVDNDAAHDVVYRFEYDALGRKTRVLVGDNPLSENVYQNDPTEAHYGTLSRMEYGNGTVVRNVYDDFNRITGVKYNDESSPRYEYAYNANGQAAYVKNNLLQQVAESEYDFSNRPSRVKTHKFNVNADGIISNTEHIYTGEVAYDDIFGRLSKFTEKVGDGYTTYATQFGYDDENRPTSLDYGDHGESTVEYDGLGRVAKTTVKAGSGTANETVYTYVAGAALEIEAPADADDERKEAAENAAGKTSTTGLVETMTQTGGSFTYTYDDNGNITRVVQDGVETAYTYDALGQLTRVDDGQENATWVYEYDQGGNILTKKKYALGVTSGTAAESKTFTYGNANWRDQLTAVNGTTITYDAIGNPLNDGTWQYEWVNGRQLARMQSVDVDASFVYNENGLRVQKTVNGVVTKYTLHGKNIVHMTQGSNELHFFYDASNKPAVVVYNGVPYSYVKNLQGDIVAILDANGVVVVNYVYDAWGRPISKTGSMAGTLGTVQPFRYRGYVYDEETGLYYLRSRYYASAWCRMLNADILPKGNAFAYCMDSPVAYADYDGFACVCCFDDNGFETPLTVLAMGIGGGGGGGSTVLVGYAAVNNAPRYKKKFEKALQDAVNVGKTVLRFIQDAVAWVKDVTADIVAFLKSLVVTSRTHTKEYMLNGGPLLGKIGVSVTTTLYQSSEPGFLYAFYESNNLDNTIGKGINLGGVLGVHAGISGDFNVFAGAQITPWFHISASVGFDGVGIAIGLDYEDVSTDFEVKCGLGLALAVVAICFGIPLPASLAPA